MSQWKKRLPTLPWSYSEEDVYNADETSLFFKLLPNRSVILSKGTYRGGKCSKEQYTVLLCISYSGTHKMKLLDIGKDDSMGNVPRLHEGSQKCLKFSAFVELDELIILIIKY